MNQPTIFDVPPYQAHSETSIAASTSMRGKTKSLRDQVFDLLRVGPLSDEEIAVALNLNPSTARPRRVELVRLGKVIAVGEGKTRSGRRAVLWGVALAKEEA